MLWPSPSEWEAMFVPETPVVELLARGTLMYLALFALLRFVLRRQSAALGVTDLLVVVLIADAAQNGLADDYSSIPEGVVVVAVVVGWAYALDWLGFHFRVVQRFTKPPRLPLVKDGELQRDNMRHELVTVGELLSQLRLQGFEDVAGVRRAYMEPDGRISVIADAERGGHRTPKRPVF